MTAEVTIDFDAGEAHCPEHGRQPMTGDRSGLCVHARQILELHDQLPKGDWRLLVGVPAAEVRS